MAGRDGAWCRMSERQRADLGPMRETATEENASSIADQSRGSRIDAGMIPSLLPGGRVERGVLYGM